MCVLEGKDISKLPLCGIYAISLLTNIPIKTVFNDYKNRFNKAGNWRGATNHIKRLELIEQVYGDKVATIDSTPKLLHFCTALENESIKTRYMIRISNHVIIYYQGKIFDQSNQDGIHYDAYKRKNSKIKVINYLTND